MNLADKTATEHGCYFDEPAAERVRKFFATFLRHSKGEFAGKPFELLPWQWEDVIKPLFGWKRADGTRRYRRAYIEVPKKNGKSTLCAGIALYLLLGDKEPGAEVYSAAADRDQAAIVFNEALNMVNASEGLSTRLKPLPSNKLITYPKGHGRYKCLSAEAYTKEGLNIHGLIFDELHAQPDRTLWDALHYGGASRRQPLFVSITTAGFDKESICYEQHLRAREILFGTVTNDAFFAYIAAADPEDDWKDPATWKKANPSYGVTVFESELAEACKDAQNSPAQENSFRRYRLNQWTEQETRWLSLDKWDSSGSTFDPKTLLGKKCFAGLDLATTTDVAALVLYFPEGHQVLPFFWVPEDTNKERERRNRVAFTNWIRQGFIEQTPGNVIDYDFIFKRVQDLGQTYRIEEIAIDRWNSTQLQTQLTGAGANVIGFGQGFASMTAPCKELEKLILDRKLCHNANPVLRWMFSNVVMKADPAGNLKPDKGKSSEKIDGIVALCMALGRAMLQLDSVYEARGLTII